MRYVYEFLSLNVDKRIKQIIKKCLGGLLVLIARKQPKRVKVN